MEFQLLGPVRVRSGGRPHRLGSDMQLALLAVLALEAGRPVPLDRLIGLMWSDTPPRGARGTVRAMVRRLRAALAELGDDVEVVRTGGGYALMTDPERVDVHRFGVLVERARAAGDEQRVALLREALALWCGPMLGDTTAALRDRLAGGYEEARLGALEDRLDAELRLGRHADVLPELAQLVAGQPLRERLAGQYMLALYRDGRAAEALGVYQRLALRIDPCAQLRELHLAILRGDSVLESQASMVVRVAELPADVSHFSGRDMDRAAVDLSCAGLTSGDRATFRLLGLVPGPDIDAPAAAALCGLPVADVVASLDRLVAARLVRRLPGDRYGCHELSRNYARERVERAESSDGRVTATNRLFEWYVERVDAAVELCCPGRLRLHSVVTSGVFADRMAALRWLDAEDANLVAVVRSAATTAGSAWVAVRLADALRGYFWLRRNGSDWLAVATAGLAAATAIGDVRGQCVTELSVADAHQCLGQHAEAIEHYQRALGHSRVGEWPVAEAAVASNLGAEYRVRGDLERAAEQLSVALRLKERIGVDTTGTLDNLAAVYRQIGLLPSALTHYHRSLRLYRESGDSGGLAHNLTGLGLTYRALGWTGLAQRRFAEALLLHRKAGNRGGEAAVLDSIAALHPDAGTANQVTEAEPVFGDQGPDQ
ncbi:MAG TPA: BTAD domain-containing putative transcriptional regulator [Pseudonocardiaceae bacterium]|nr:BTAD domain-containing putative transcriptional regulator [Pseudonocardiaceae bacterium]